MKAKTIREIALAWKNDKQRYVKQSTYAAYALVLENHILPTFGDCETLSEKLVQEFVLQKLDGGLGIKTVKDMLIVLRMVMKFGVKNGWMNYQEWDIKYPTVESNKDIEVYVDMLEKSLGAKEGTMSFISEFLLEGQVHSPA